MFEIIEEAAALGVAVVVFVCVAVLPLAALGALVQWLVG